MRHLYTGPAIFVNTHDRCKKAAPDLQERKGNPNSRFYPHKKTTPTRPGGGGTRKVVRPHGREPRMGLAFSPTAFFHPFQFPLSAPFVSGELTIPPRCCCIFIHGPHRGGRCSHGRRGLPGSQGNSAQQSSGIGEPRKLRHEDFMGQSRGLPAGWNGPGPDRGQVLLHGLGGAGNALPGLPGFERHAYRTPPCPGSVR